MASLLLAAAAPPLLSRLPSTSSKASSFSFSFSHSEAFGSPLFAQVASLSTSASSSSYPSPIPSGSVYCGRGDRKTEKGKRFNHSYGNARPHGKKKGRGPLRPYAPPAPSKKDRFEDNEIVKIEIDED